MSRNKHGSKTGRRERHLARQAALRERKKLRQKRAARFAHLPGLSATHGMERVAPVVTPNLERLTVGTLHVIARDQGCEVRDRHRKSDLIAMIEAKYEAIR